MPRTSAARVPLAVAPEPGVDAARFRAALGRFPTGVALVTADDDGTPPGVPRLAGAIAFLECEIDAEHRAGDHSIVVGRVLRAETAAGLPLLNWASAFGRLASGHDSETR